LCQSIYSSQTAFKFAALSTISVLAPSWPPCRSQTLLDYSPRRLSQLRILPGQVRQPLERKSFHDGTAIFQVTLQGRGGTRSLLPAQRQSRQHERKVPPQLDLLGFIHKAQQFLFVGIETTLGARA